MYQNTIKLNNTSGFRIPQFSTKKIKKLKMWVTERNYPSTRTSSINGSKQSFWRGFGRHGHGNKNSDESHHQPKPLSCAATLLLNLRFHHHTVTQCRCFRNKAPSFSQTQKKIAEEH